MFNRYSVPEGEGRGEEQMDLEQLWEDQLEFTRQVISGTRDLVLGEVMGPELISITKEYVLSLHNEVDELLGELSWKEHRKSDTPLLTKDNVLEEMVDVQKFLWGLMQIWGVDFKEFRQAYLNKSFVVRKRWEMEQAQLSSPLLVVDIDGVLYRDVDMFQLWLTNNRPHLVGLSKRDNARAWEEARFAYRQSHEKRYGEAFQENIRALRTFKDAGWSVVLMTYRPKRVFKSLEYDTLYWLERNQVPYDRLIWAAYEKYFYMRDEIEQADVFIDDELETCQMVSSLGNRVYWVNTGTDSLEVSGLRAVSSLVEVLEVELGVSIIG